MIRTVQNNCPLGELTGSIEKAYVVVKDFAVKEVENRWGIGLQIGEEESDDGLQQNRT